MRIEYDVESEYSGEVSSWRSRDSLDLLTTCQNSLVTRDLVTCHNSPLVTLDYIDNISNMGEAATSTPVLPRDPRRWRTDRLCRSFSAPSPPSLLDITTPGCLSETVDSIEYFSPLYSPSSEASGDDTVVMLLTTDDEAGASGEATSDHQDISLASQETQYDIPELLSLLHWLHTEEDSLDEDIVR